MMGVKSNVGAMLQMDISKSGESEAVILVKASPNIGAKHGETVCIAAIDLQGNWLRLYPVSFRQLEDEQKFGRWDRIKFKWRKPNASSDSRPESRRVDQQSVEIVGLLREAERERFLAKSVVTSLKAEREKDKSLALLRPEIIDYFYEKISEEELNEQAAKFQLWRNQLDLFSKKLVPFKPCPFSFKYKYRDADGDHVGTCQDWETEATFFNWAREYGEQAALNKMLEVFGKEYPEKGMVLAMGTHSRRPEQWLINGIIRLNRISQDSLF
jgi:hypothetical protein